ncbi:unnamed protein product, partial [Rotaria sp. Silwood2]
MIQRHFAWQVLVIITYTYDDPGHNHGGSGCEGY